MKTIYLWKFHFTHSNSSVVRGFKVMGKEREGQRGSSYLFPRKYFSLLLRTSGTPAALLLLLKNSQLCLLWMNKQAQIFPKQTTFICFFPPCPQLAELWEEALPWEPAVFQTPPSSSSSQLEWRVPVTGPSLSPQPSCIDLESLIKEGINCMW